MCVRLLIASLFLVGAVARADGWTTEDKISEGLYQAALAADWYQTDMIARSHGVYGEGGAAARWIGHHPSRGAVALYMLGSAGAHWVITDRMVDAGAPQWLRRAWQASSFAYEAHTVRINWSIGLKP